MPHRLYKVTVYKRDGDGVRRVYGARCTTEPLGRACKKLVKMFGQSANVRLVEHKGRRRYLIADGLAEMEPIGW